MARMSKEDKRIEQECNSAFAKHSAHNVIDAFDIGKVLDAGRAAGKAGQNIEEAIKAAFAQYRKA